MRDPGRQGRPTRKAPFSYPHLSLLPRARARGAKAEGDALPGPGRARPAFRGPSHFNNSLPP
ncbi:hypothetical protein BDY21DRAFT_357542 [Lineolata rhizophorae]|uniref:Uncharacterized protein n=1 Tax=Lineolata rhizophorae TaxID=578093 RepID=A0A6A6NNU5_9PEZI|nr:hypothetical protein BDY21DRAFT_357542 [Lineolata rhizophorae]